MCMRCRLTQAVEITMDINQQLYEATTLLKALTLLKRIEGG